MESERLEQYKRLIEGLENYISLLQEELNETVSLAYLHGWRSTRHELGVKAREEIERANFQLGREPNNNTLG